MTNQQILEKAIKKAIDGGWKDAHIYPFNLPVHQGIGTASHRLFFGDCAEATMLIFNHDFAKALWGEDGTESITYKVFSSSFASKLNVDKSCQLSLWQYHLQQMVIANDPIKYLGENI